MSTIIMDGKLSLTLFGKTRRAVLALLYSHADESFYLRQIARQAGVAPGPLQRELSKLTNAGIIRRTVRGRQVYYQANPESPAFKDLKNLVIKTIGVGDVVRSALIPLSDRIKLAFIHGSMVRGKENRRSDIDVVVVGDVSFAEVTSSLSEIQERVGREINPTVYPVSEFAMKIAKGHHFLNSIIKGELLFLIGDKRELARLAKKRLAD